jgi:hypothetical protein
MGIAIDLTAAGPRCRQSQLILAIPVELIPHTAPFPGPFSFFDLAGAVDAGGCP